MKDEVSLCSLIDACTVYDFLKNELHITHSQIKKSGVNKKFLNRILKLKSEFSIPINLLNHLRINPNCSIEDIEVIDEDEEFLIIHKPPFTHMHPLKYTDDDTLLNYLVTSSYQGYLNVNSHSYDRGLLYRLDYETSGLVIYAKSTEVYEKYRSNFDELIKEKYYIAICSGDVSDMTLKDNISYRGNKKARGYISGSGDFSAFIKVEKIEYNETLDLSLVKVFLFEGIRHQIRIQLAHAGHAILGDELYGKVKANRLFLHCYEYKLDNKSFKDELLVGFSEFFNFDGKL
jgi:23S rRNA pseudouridine1911/1915/1917 synthase